MSTKRVRWLLNMGDGTLHDRTNLDERCNTDQIERKHRFLTDSTDEAMTHLAFRKACQWCAKKTARRTRVIANPDVADASPAS